MAWRQSVRNLRLENVRVDGADISTMMSRNVTFCPRDFLIQLASEHLDTLCRLYGTYDLITDNHSEPHGNLHMSREEFERREEGEPKRALSPSEKFKEILKYSYKRSLMNPHFVKKKLWKKVWTRSFNNSYLKNARWKKFILVEADNKKMIRHHFRFMLNSVLLNYFHAAVSRCLAVLTVKPGEALVNPNESDLSRIPGNTIKEKVNSENNLFTAELIKEEATGDVLQFNVAYVGEEWKPTSERDPAAMERLERVAGSFPQMCFSSSQPVGEDISKRLLKMKKRFPSHIQSLKILMPFVWGGRDTCTVPAAMTANFYPTENFLLNLLSAKKGMLTERDLIATPAQALKTTQDFDSMCTEDYLRTVSFCQHPMEDALERLCKWKFKPADPNLRTELVSMIASKRIFKHKKLLFMATKVYEKLSKASHSGTIRKKYPNEIHHLSRLLRMIGDIHDNTGLHKGNKARFIRTMALCWIGRHSLNTSDLRLGKEYI